jgi:hypothetical protein
MRLKGYSMTPGAYRVLLTRVFPNSTTRGLKRLLRFCLRHSKLLTRGGWQGGHPEAGCLLTQLARGHPEFHGSDAPGLDFALWLGRRNVCELVNAWDANEVSLEEIAEILRNELFLRGSRKHAFLYREPVCS